MRHAADPQASDLIHRGNVCPPKIAPGPTKAVLSENRPDGLFLPGRTYFGGWAGGVGAAFVGGAGIAFV